jgi:hypothetical protein
LLEEGGHWYGKLNGWLLIPNAAPKDVPVVLIIPGWTGFKEEMYSAMQHSLLIDWFQEKLSNGGKL